MDQRLINLYILSFVLFANQTYSQFSPPAGILGTDAIYKDSSIFVEWAHACVLQKSYQNIVDSSLGFVQAGDEFSAIGEALQNGTVSLGDGGSIICTFNNPVQNQAGPDFAVFENSFCDTFLELAFVDVSSDGVYFKRFPAVSNTQTIIQKSSFDSLDARQIYNLAGKYRAGYGTPFNLDELEGDSMIDLNHITHIRIQDVVGILDSTLGSFDHQGNLINDPFPTPFFSGGFDLDAIGIIHQQVSIKDLAYKNKPYLYPNPLPSNSSLKFSHAEQIDYYTICDLMGQEINTLTTSLRQGIYLINIHLKNNLIYTQKLIVQ